MLCEKNSGSYGIFHVHKIATLAAVGELGAITLEQRDTAAFLHLIERFVDHASHFTLVILIRAKDIEVLHACYTRQHSSILRITVKQVIRICIHVKRE